MATTGSVASNAGSITTSTVSVIPDTRSDAGNDSKRFATKVVGIVGAAIAFLAIIVLIASALIRWRRQVLRRNAAKRSKADLSFDEQRLQRCLKMTISNSGKLLTETLSQTPKKHIHFPIYDLSLATNNFDEGNLLGEGGFGKVYRGVLATPPFSKVAIKVLTGSSLQGVKEFITEIEVLSRLDHKHLVRLLGSCMVGEQLLLVYRHVANGSLSDHLHGGTGAIENSQNQHSRTIFTWAMRVKIALGAALGIQHLHLQQPVVLHRDIKAANILLTRGFNAKVCDFGFAKQLSGSQDDPMRFCCTPSRSGAIGTLGYVAPESMMTGELSTASDVYSFGVVLLELLSGRKPLDFAKADKDQSLVYWARALLDQERMSELIDPSIPEEFCRIRESVLLFLRMTRACLDIESRVRPTMGEVVQTLFFVIAEYECYPDALVINLSDSESSGDISPRELSNRPHNLSILDLDRFSRRFLGSDTETEVFSKAGKRSSTPSPLSKGPLAWLSLGNFKPSTPARG